MGVREDGRSRSQSRMEIHGKNCVIVDADSNHLNYVCHLSSRDGLMVELWTDNSLPSDYLIEMCSELVVCVCTRVCCCIYN